MLYAGSVIVIPPNMFIMLFFRRSRQFVPPGRRRKIRQERESVAAIPLFEDSNKTEGTNKACERFHCSVVRLNEEIICSVVMFTVLITSSSLVKRVKFQTHMVFGGNSACLICSRMVSTIQ